MRETSLPAGKLFADSAYDAEETFELSFEKGLTPIIKPRINSKKGFFRKKARRAWSKRAYDKYRSRVETVFAGSQARNHNTVRERRVATRRRAVVLLAVAHNLRTAIRLGLKALERVIRQLGRLHETFKQQRQPKLLHVKRIRVRRS